jgi:Methyltransferase domain
LPRLLEANERYDFIYIDGSHLFENVFVDAFYCARLLNDGGFIAFDDSTDAHVAKVMAFIRGNLTETLKEVLPEDVRSTIARLVGRRQLTIFERLSGRSSCTELRKWNSPLGRF